MNFPQKFMKMNDLIKLGFPREMLMRLFREEGQTFAFKMNPEKKNSHIVFDTDGLARKIEREIKIERSIRS